MHNAGCDPLPPHPQFVSSGLDKPPICHPDDTQVTQAVLSALRNGASDSTDERISNALKKTAHIGSETCLKLRSSIFSAHPPLSNSLSRHYIRTAEEKNYLDANAELLNLHDSLIVADFNASFEPNEVSNLAKKVACHCTLLAYEAEDVQSAYAALSEIAKQYTITPPEPKRHMFSPCLSKMSDERWWLRKFKTLQLQRVEEVARKIGLVQKHASTYSSLFSQQARKHQKAKNNEYLENQYIVNEKGRNFSLKDIYSRSVSNPAIRRTELMVRLKGFEEIAELMGHASEFYTATAPSCMHARSAKSGLKNAKFDGSTVNQAHKLLHNQGRCAIAKLKRKGIEVYGFRVVEPHHDGTPHYHWLLFMKPEHRKVVRNTFRDYALRDKPNEKGASKHRFKAELIDKAKGGATAYIAKYISKNIDGIHIDDDCNGNTGTHAAQAIDAWASTHKIRQFQQIGGHSVTVWRELRRLANLPLDTSSHSPGFIKALQAADSSNWAAYTLTMGGPFRGGGTEPLIKPYYESQESIDLTTGEILDEALTEHGDIKCPTLKGLTYGDTTLITRIHEWTIVNEAHPDGLLLLWECPPQGDSAQRKSEPLDLCK